MFDKSPLPWKAKDGNIFDANGRLVAAQDIVTFISERKIDVLAPASDSITLYSAKTNDGKYITPYYANMDPKWARIYKGQTAAQRLATRYNRKHGLVDVKYPNFARKISCVLNFGDFI